MANIQKLLARLEPAPLPQPKTDRLVVRTTTDEREAWQLAAEADGYDTETAFVRAAVNARATLVLQKMIKKDSGK